MPFTRPSDALASATEAAARAVHPHLGTGSLERIDEEAVRAIRQAFAEGRLCGRVAIGEGEKDNAPMLHGGELVGPPGEPTIDLAVDPIDGTRAAARGEFGAVSAIASAPSGHMLRPGSVAYMEKLVGPPGAGLELDMATHELVNKAARCLEIPVARLRVAVLDRPRNYTRMQEVRASGAQLISLPYADLSASVSAAMGAGSIGLLLGIGGCAEGVVAAVAASALGATMRCRLWPRSPEEREQAEETGLSCSDTYDAASLVGSEELSLAITGVTGSVLVEPIRADEHGLAVHTLRIDSEHSPCFTRTKV